MLFSDAFTLIGVWALPVILLQWLLGMDILLSRWKVWIAGSAILSAYLTVIDALLGRAWYLNPLYAGGLRIPLLDYPLESALYILFANLLLVQSILLGFYLPTLRKRVRGTLRALRRGPFAPQPEPPADANRE